MSDLLRVEVDGDRLCLSGELDLSSTSTLTDALAAHDGQEVVLDLAGVTFLDSTGIRALVEARRARAGVRVVNPTEAIRRLFDLTGTLGVLLDEDA